MTDATLITTVGAAGIASVTLNRPEVHNAFDDYLISQLMGELRRLADDPAVRAVVLAARGNSFSAGADINWMRRMADYSHEKNLADARELAELLRTLYTLPKLTIAKIQGPAFGGGVGLVACCDVAIASEQAAFCLSEVRLGLIPAVISPYVVKAMGERQARRYCATAERFDAYQALRSGLVHEVVPHDDLDARVERLLQDLSGSGPLAMSAAKSMVCAVAGKPIDDALIDYTAARIAELRASQEAREGLDAFLNKRLPAWHRDFKPSL